MPSSIRIYSIRNMPSGVIKAVKVAAAMEGIPIWKWCVRELKNAARRAGVVIEEGD